MILVQNHLLQLSGSKNIFLILMGLFLAACSPKIQPVKTVPGPVEKKEDVEKVAKKFTEANISLLIPFNLQDYKTQPKTKDEVEKHSLAIDFYQGFKLGIDSAAALGLNFKLKVFDSQDDNVHLTRLINSNQLAGSDLLVGPVFPKGVKMISNYSIANKIPVVSPLAASQPSEFGNPNLISVVNNIHLHAARIGDYISKKYTATEAVVVLINTKSPADEVFAQPLREYFLHQKQNNLPFVEFASVFTMETKVAKQKKYVVLLSSSDQKFVAATLNKLSKMKGAGYNIDLFGHPDWVKQNYAVDKLQALNTIVTSSYHVDYKKHAVIDFVKRYRKAYNFEPGEFAFKGFDIGFYFGKQFAAHGRKYLNYLSKEKYNGLHNTFTFQHDEQFGFVNTSLTLLQYRGFSLNVIQ